MDGIDYDDDDDDTTCTRNEEAHRAVQIQAHFRKYSLSRSVSIA